MKSIDPSALDAIGNELNRPECVVATASGRVFVSDSRAAIREVYKSRSEPITDVKLASQEFCANGFSLLPDGSFLVANIGTQGGVWKVRAGSQPEPVLMEVEGYRLPPVNFVNVTGETDAWVSVSTRHQPRDQAFRADVADGFIVYMDGQGARIVADNIGFTNENKLHPDGNWLYVSETIARRLSRYPVRNRGDLGRRETVIEFSDGIWPDGFEFDSTGGIWIASVVSNRLLRLSPEGELTVILDDSDPDVVANAETHFSTNTFGREHIDAGRHRALGNLSSVCFSGTDLKTVLLGSLFAQRIATFRSPVAGIKPGHWNWL